MDRREFCKRIAFGAAALGMPPWVESAERGAGEKGSERSPNVIIIFADDQGYQDIGCFGSPDIATPNLDRMAAEGTKFTDFYAAAPICSPSRASLLTGCYPRRVGITRVLFPKDAEGLHPSEVTLAEILKARGYATACIGKWHLGHLPEFLPTEQGFDRYFGIPYSNDMTIDPAMALADEILLREGMTRERIREEKPRAIWAPLLRDTQVIEYPADQSTLTRRYTEEAIRFIEARKDRPFFLYLPHTMPHVPLAASKAFKGRSKRGLYGDVIEEIDWSTGEILGALRRLGIDTNTLVIYTSDNGPWLAKGRDGGSAKPLRDGKFSTYEGGMREPCIMRWPGRIPAGRVCSEIASTIDLLPTIAALAGGKAPDDRVIDGKDIRPLMAGTPGARSPHEAFFYGTAAVRSGKWKLHRVKGGAALYDLEADVGETKDVAAEHPDIVERLQGTLDAFEKDLKANSRPAGRAKAGARA